MANTLTDVTPKLLAQGLMALRGTTIMVPLVNNDYAVDFANHGVTVNVPVPSAIAVAAVSPSNTPPSTTDMTLETVALTLDQWYEAPFYLTDKDIQQAMDGIIPMQASEAIKALAENINSHIFSKYIGVYGFVGTPGTTPFGTSTGTSDATGARKILNKQKCPLADRRFVIDPDAEANALDLRAFQDASFAASPEVIMDGQITRKLGFMWAMDQQVPTHTAGTLSNGSTHTAKVNVAVSAGVKTMDVDETTLTGTIVPGEIFTVAGDTQTYVVTNTSTLTASGNAVTGITFEPGSVAGFADDAVVTFKDTHVVNLAFHRDAFAFASRPLADQAEGLGNIIDTMSDPISGVTLRLEISREHKRTRFSYDILYGAALIRRELACRVAG